MNNKKNTLTLLDLKVDSSLLLKMEVKYMKLRSDLFPYPVLSNELDDFSNGKFNVSISQRKISVSRFLITF